MRKNSFKQKKALWCPKAEQGTSLIPNITGTIRPVIEASNQVSNQTAQNYQNFVLGQTQRLTALNELQNTGNLLAGLTNGNSPTIAPAQLSLSA